MWLLSLLLLALSSLATHSRRPIESFRVISYTRCMPLILYPSTHSQPSCTPFSYERPTRHSRWRRSGVSPRMINSFTCFGRSSRVMERTCVAESFFQPPKPLNSGRLQIGPFSPQHILRHPIPPELRAVVLIKDANTRSWQFNLYGLLFSTMPIPRSSSKSIQGRRGFYHRTQCYCSPLEWFGCFTRRVFISPKGHIWRR